MTAAGAEEVAEFAMLATEASSGIVALEAAHTSDPCSGNVSPPKSQLVTGISF
jgi:hypothetical protein